MYPLTLAGLDEAMRTLSRKQWSDFAARRGRRAGRRPAGACRPATAFPRGPRRLALRPERPHPRSPHPLRRAGERDALCDPAEPDAGAGGGDPAAGAGRRGGRGAGRGALSGAYGVHGLAPRARGRAGAARAGASICGSGTDFNAHTGDTDTYYRIDLARPDRRADRAHPPPAARHRRRADCSRRTRSSAPGPRSSRRRGSAPGPTTGASATRSPSSCPARGSPAPR